MGGTASSSCAQHFLARSRPLLMPRPTSRTTRFASSELSFPLNSCVFLAVASTARNISSDVLPLLPVGLPWLQGAQRAELISVIPSTAAARAVVTSGPRSQSTCGCRQCHKTPTRNEERVLCSRASWFILLFARETKRTQDGGSFS